MNKSLYFNASKAFDPTAGAALNRIAKEQQNKEAWLNIARQIYDGKSTETKKPVVAVLKS